MSDSQKPKAWQFGILLASLGAVHGTLAVLCGLLVMAPSALPFPLYFPLLEALALFVLGLGIGKFVRWSLGE